MKMRSGTTPFARWLDPALNLRLILVGAAIGFGCAASSTWADSRDGESPSPGALRPLVDVSDRRPTRRVRPRSDVRQRPRHDQNDLRSRALDRASRKQGGYENEGCQRRGGGRRASKRPEPDQQLDAEHDARGGCESSATSASAHAAVPRHMSVVFRLRVACSVRTARASLRCKRFELPVTRSITGCSFLSSKTFARLAAKSSRSKTSTCGPGVSARSKRPSRSKAIRLAARSGSIAKGGSSGTKSLARSV